MGILEKLGIGGGEKKRHAEIMTKLERLETIVHDLGFAELDRYRSISAKLEKIETAIEKIAGGIDPTIIQPLIDQARSVRDELERIGKSGTEGGVNPDVERS